MTSLLYRLKEAKEVLEGIGCENNGDYSDEGIDYVLDLLCNSGLCANAASKGQCMYYGGCLVALRKQISPPAENSVSITSLNSHLKGKTKRQLKAERKLAIRKYQKQKIPPTPTFFCSQGFEEVVDGDNNRKQNPIERLPNNFTGIIDSRTQVSKSRVYRSSKCRQKSIRTEPVYN
jgi:hypothetical protein